MLTKIGHLQIAPDAVPELRALHGVPQPAKHHPEMDTHVHVMMALEQARLLSPDPAAHWAVLLHDLGKGLTAPELLPAHHGHEEAGVPRVRAVCSRMGVPDDWTELAVLVCEHHTDFLDMVRVEYEATLIELTHWPRQFANYRNITLDRWCALCGYAQGLEKTIAAAATDTSKMACLRRFLRKLPRALPIEFARVGIDASDAAWFQEQWRAHRELAIERVSAERPNLAERLATLAAD